MTHVSPGQRVAVVAPHSEVCMHMQIAGRVMLAEILPSGRAAQLYTLDGREYSAPVTTGEAGFYRDDEGFYIQNEVCLTCGRHPILRGTECRGCLTGHSEGVGA